MHVGIIPFIIGLIYKSKWYKMMYHPFGVRPEFDMLNYNNIIPSGL